MSKSVVPVIDVSALRAGTDETAEMAVIAEISEACERIGFFLITGHGVPSDLLEACYEDIRSFFDLPTEQKLEVQRPNPRVSRGYLAMGKRSIASSMGKKAPTDLHEIYAMGPVDELTTPDADDEYMKIHFAANVWPSAPTTFREHAVAYYRAMSDLAGSLMSAFARALEMPAGYFDPMIDRSPSNLQFINYPDQDTAPLPGQLRAAEHTDFGTLTILRVEDAPGGLQVQDRTGQWHDVGYVDGSFVINIGDVMARWTNDKWVSTLHRVANPPPELARRSRRISIPFFHHANHDAVMECIPTCLAPGETPKYETITAGEHWRRKREAMTLAAQSYVQ